MADIGIVAPFGNPEVMEVDNNPVEHNPADTNSKALLDIFPDADPAFIALKCHDMRYLNIGLNDMIGHILDNEYPRVAPRNQNPPIIVDLDRPSTSRQSQPEHCVIDITDDTNNDEAMNLKVEHNWEQHVPLILDLIPDADPDFVETKCKEFAGNNDMVQVFALDCLDRKNYPKKIVAECSEKSEIQEGGFDICKYAQNFDISEFLKANPDPVNYYTDERRTGREYEKYAKIYLRRRYRIIRAAHLDSTLEANGFNLTRACNQLDQNIRGKMKHMRPLNDIVAMPFVKSYIPLYQEIRFIENRAKIEAYMQNQAEEKRRLFQQAKENNELLECSICYDSEVMMQDIASCMDGHVFCKTCIKRGVEVEIGNGKTELVCFDTKCTAEFSFKLLQELLLPNVFSKLLARRQLEEVQSASIEGLESCPFCTFATIPPPDDRIFKCMNPECLKESCRQCKEPNHIPLRCNEVEKPKDVEARTYIENKMTEALVRECWRCHQRFIKEDGCNKMTCKCGAHTCYICRQPVQDYTHFGGQGTNNPDKCPLHTDINLLHVDAVKEAAKRAKLEVSKENPEANLINDPSTLLPTRQSQTTTIPGMLYPHGLVMNMALHPVVRGGDDINIGRHHDCRHPAIPIINPVNGQQMFGYNQRYEPIRAPHRLNAVPIMAHNNNLIPLNLNHHHGHNMENRPGYRLPYNAYNLQRYNVIQDPIANNQPIPAPPNNQPIPAPNGGLANAAVINMPAQIPAQNPIPIALINDMNNNLHRARQQYHYNNVFMYRRNEDMNNVLIFNPGYQNGIRNAGINEQNGNAHNINQPQFQ